MSTQQSDDLNRAIDANLDDALLIFESFRGRTLQHRWETKNGTRYIIFSHPDEANGGDNHISIGLPPDAFGGNQAFELAFAKQSLADMDAKTSERARIREQRRAGR